MSKLGMFLAEFRLKHA